MALDGDIPRLDSQRKRRGRRRDASAKSLSLSGAKVLPMKDLDVGETDANSEYFISQRTKNDPMYMKAFFEWNGVSYDDLKNGRKFILYGQKGTGKTALLRHLEVSLSSQYLTSFVVFRKEILEEAQLAQMAATISAAIIVDEEGIKKSKFYYHAMKRLVLTLLLSKCSAITDFPEDVGWFKSLYSEIRSSSVGQIAALVTDSVVGSLESLTINLDRATKGIVGSDPAKAIKRSNDAFQKFAFERFQKSSLKARIFLDEMHFAYRDEGGLSADAALVRDTIMAVKEINERLIEGKIDSLIYISIRSEFLEHQEISSADVSHTIESYGIELSWESAPFDRAHPMFGLILKRLRVYFGDDFTIDDLFARFMPERSAPKFLEYTWGKPRDIIRYFRNAISCYPNSGSIRSPNEFGNILRRYSQAAWQDQKSALASFVPKNSIPLVEEALQEVANHDLDRSVDYDKLKLEATLRPAFEHMQQNGVKYEISEFIKLLYIVGILYVTYRDAKGQQILHQFHRGNRKPYPKGNFHIHRAVARALS